MKRNEQEQINKEVLSHMVTSLHEPRFYMGQLYHCNAQVYVSDNYILLKSYDTFIACIDKSNDVCYDFLRKVYDYTATSTRHIAKFVKKYGSGSVLQWKWLE